MSDRVGCLSELTCCQNKAGAIWYNQICRRFDSLAVACKKHSPIVSSVPVYKKKHIQRLTK